MTTLDFCRSCGGKLENQQAEGRVRRVCSSCGLVAYENPVPATAAVVLDELGRVLLVLRNKPPHKGRWCLPGGFLEVDETPEAGCLRELAEETGLTGNVTDLVGLEMGENPQYKAVLVVGYHVVVTGGALKAGDDSDEACFFPLNEMPPVAFRSHRLLLQRALRSQPPRNKRVAGHWGAYVITSGDHVQVAENACNGGARVIQFRDKEMSRRDMLVIARRLREITRRAEASLIINDSIDIAILSEADGVHLGQDDIHVRDARRLIPEKMLVGVSTHSPEQAVQACQDGADYIGIGPVFATPTKADYPPIGLDTVRRVLSENTVPAVVIGGINNKNLQRVVEIGAGNIAMVRAFREDASEMVSRVNEMLRTRDAIRQG